MWGTSFCGGSYELNSTSKEKNRCLQFAYRLSIVLTVFGVVFLLAGFFVFGYENNELNFVVIGGIIIVLVGLVIIPLIVWSLMTKKEYNLKI